MVRVHLRDVRNTALHPLVVHKMLPVYAEPD